MTRGLRLLVALAVVLGGWSLRGLTAGPTPTITQILGRPTFDTVTLNVRAEMPLEWYAEYGRREAQLDQLSGRLTSVAGEPSEVVLEDLVPDAPYFYRVRYRQAGTAGAFDAGDTLTFHTPRLPGSTFTFAAQGDSHPERANSMFDAELYERTLTAVAAEHPDFYLTSGDDFSVDTLRTLSRQTVTERYTLQVPYLSIVGRASPLFLVNGNHEQAARYLLDGSPDNVAVWAQTARNRFFPQPAPDGFYSGNPEVVPHIGLLRNYYAWEWGDALFVVIDPYWSSPVAVDNVLGNRQPKRVDQWQITHGDEQYAWLRDTLTSSRARWKFVFAHHPLGTGRGGVEMADAFEWGGRNANGTWGFDTHRPAWELPIHQLMAATGVTIFFQGHDHLFAHQEKDGVVYQELPNPADFTYTAFNEDAYRTGETFPNSGYVKVTVGPQQVHVEYIRMFLPQDEQPPALVSGMVQFAYTIPARR
jgi:hypothetical protein